jgi:hypothetical protein
MAGDELLINSDDIFRKQDYSILAHHDVFHATLFASTAAVTR